MEPMMKLDNFDDCVLGVAYRANTKTIIVYDKLKVIEKLITTYKMTYDEAHEHFNKNIVGAWVGETTPCFFMKKTMPMIESEVE